MPTLLRPPGPKNRGLIGNFPMGGKDPLGTFTQWSRTYGDIFYYRFLHRHVYFFNHPDLIKEVLVTQALKFRKGDVVRANRRVFGNGLLSNEGASWLEQRRLIQPAFHRSRIDIYAETMVSYTQRMATSWRPGEVRDFHQDMMRLTLEIVSLALFSVEIASHEDRFAVALNTLMQLSSGGRMLLPEVFRRIPTRENRRYDRAIRELDEIVYSIIGTRQTNAHADRNDLLSTLMDAQYDDGSSMSVQQLRDEVMTLLLAGHETTAVSLSWVWFLLSQHTEVEQQLWSEIDRVLNGRAPTVQDISRLPHTERIVREAMRLYPPAWAIVRTAIADAEIGGYTIPAGANVIMSQWVTHRDPRFYDQPDEFLPDRWLEDRHISKPRFAYFPFGGGPRICIGSSFAMTEAVLVLVTIAQRWQARLASPTPPEPVPGITLRPRNGLKIYVLSR
ncbi:MAG TPA: cytochrome P450 [Acidobacteriaceae bacterium]|nr:cytochrome P450 [Acidobacteriaceae bacterium]